MTLLLLPQNLIYYEEIFNDLKNNLIINDETLIVSILAGIKIKRLKI